MNRIGMVTIVVLLVTAHSFAEVAFGVNFNSELRNNSYNRENSGSTDIHTNDIYYNLGINPTVLIFTANILEINPFFGFNYGTHSRYENEDQTSDGPKNIGFNAGCGLYFRLIKGEVFRFSIGPRLSYSMNFTVDSDAFNLDAGLGVPANIDFKLSKHFLIRTSPTLLNIGYYHQVLTENENNGSFYFDIISYGSMSISFLFSF